MFASMLVAAALVAADDSVKAFVDACEQRRPAVLAELEGEIKAKRIQLKNGGNVQELRNRIDQIQKDVAALRRLDDRCLDLCGGLNLVTGNLAVGNVLRGNESLQVSQVIDSGNVLAGWGRASALWITDFDSRELSDRSSIKLPQFIEVVGTKTYQTIIGDDQTVFVVRRFNIEQAKQLWRERHPVTTAVSSRK